MTSDEVKALIKQRRRQMVVHSIIYYRYGDSIIPDGQFDKYAYELVQLQKDYPKESKEVELYEEFKDWDGTTGYHLSSIPHFTGVVERLLDYVKKNNV